MPPVVTIADALQRALSRALLVVVVMLGGFAEARRGPLMQRYPR